MITDQKEWIERATKRFMDEAGLDEEKAKEFARVSYHEHDRFDELSEITPEDAVDNEVSYWGD